MEEGQSVDSAPWSQDRKCEAERSCNSSSARQIPVGPEEHRLGDSPLQPQTPEPGWLWPAARLQIPCTPSPGKEQGAGPQHSTPGDP